MSKIGLTSIILLVTILCTGLHQTTAAEVAKSDKTEDSSKIRIPDKGSAIVLRAPMSENPQVVKISKNQKEDTVSGFTVSLPKNTPTFFRVDQVNTVLYTVEITIKAEKINERKSRINLLVNPQQEIPLPRYLMRHSNTGILSQQFPNPVQRNLPRKLQRQPRRWKI